MAQIPCYELKGDLSPVMPRKFSNFQGFVWKPLKRDWVARVVYPIQILLLLRYTAENVHFC